MKGKESIKKKELLVLMKTTEFLPVSPFTLKISSYLSAVHVQVNTLNYHNDMRFYMNVN